MKTQNFTKVFLFALLMSILIKSPTLLAQNFSKDQPSGGGGFTIGYGYMDISALQKFVPTSVSTFRNEQMVIGGTGHGFIGNFVIGGGGYGIVGDLVKTDTIKYSLGGGIGTFDFGYLLLNKEKVKIYPMIGIGGGGYGIQITKIKAASINEVVNNSSREINISIGGFVFDFSLNLNLIPVINYNEKDKSYGGFMTGLKIGYLFNLPSSNWSFTGGDITGGPNFGLNMVYAKIIIGGFGYQTKK